MPFEYARMTRELGVIMLPSREANMWKDRSVFLTGHTGFKGTWLAVMLESLGARVFGYSLKPEKGALFESVESHLSLAGSVYSDIRDRGKLQFELEKSSPEVVFHLAAQPLVKQSIADPVDTFQTNVLGTTNLLDICRNIPSLKAIIVITTDKVYAPENSLIEFREDHPLGGKDPYSASKSCCELLTNSFRDTYFQHQGSALVATARAGNVIGPGDMSVDRIVPDIARACMNDSLLNIRFPNAIRPWQHVADPLLGYIKLAESLLLEQQSAASAWNFGSDASIELKVVDLVRIFQERLAGRLQYQIQQDQGVETKFLALDSSKAKKHLGWNANISVIETVDQIVKWMRKYEISNSDAALEILHLVEQYMQKYYKVSEAQSGKYVKPTVRDKQII